MFYHRSHHKLYSKNENFMHLQIPPNINPNDNKRLHKKIPGVVSQGSFLTIYTS